MTDAQVAVPKPPPARTTSILPALVVVVIAVGTLGLFGLLNVVLPSSTTATTLPVIVGTLPSGHGLFQHVVQGGEPPPNIASAFIDPAGTRLLASVPTGGDADYDLEYRLEVHAPRAELLGFYRSDLVALGWSLFSVSGGGTSDKADLLFQKAGSDGSYWDAGVVATATTPTETTYTFRMFQDDDFG